MSSFKHWVNKLVFKYLWNMYIPNAFTICSIKNIKVGVRRLGVTLIVTLTHHLPSLSLSYSMYKVNINYHVSWSNVCVMYPAEDLYHKRLPIDSNYLYYYYPPCKVGATDTKFITCPEWAIILNRVKCSIYFCTGN